MKNWSSIVLLSLLVIIALYCVYFFRDLSRSSTIKAIEPALLIVSFDGFRADYLNRNVTPNLNQFRKEGVSAQYMIPVFPTKTYVNHFSIATGLYPENHGIVANAFYDTELGYLRYSYDLFHYNESTIPIWTANEMAGKNSGCWWPGADYQYNNVSCTFTRSYNGSVPFEERVDTIMTWFTHEDTPANLVMLYIEEPDEQSHMYGTNANQITNMVAKLDQLANYIQNKLIANNLKNRVNVIYLSDHGMTGVPISKVIDLTQFLTNNTYKIYGNSPILQIVPNDPSEESEMFANLTKAAKQNGHFSVYNKHNLPERWHANNTRRTGPIIALANAGYAFQDLLRSAKIYQNTFNVPMTNESRYGVHGYDNEDPDMRALFIAKGPNFSKNKQIKPFENINLYHLICLIINIKCPNNDGSKDPNFWNGVFL